VGLAPVVGCHDAQQVQGRSAKRDGVHGDCGLAVEILCNGT
jgi:hypothetical protein